MVHGSLKLTKHNTDIEHRAGMKNVLADSLFHNPQEGMEGVEEVKACVLSSLVMRSRDKLIQYQKGYSEFCDLYSYLEDPNGIDSFNATNFEKLFQSFKWWSFLF